MASQDPIAMVHTALNNPKFIENHAEFWNMIGFMMKPYKEKPLWQQVPRDDICKFVLQLQTLIESIEIYEELQKNAGHLYNAYMMTIARLKGAKNMQQWEGYESLNIMKAVLHVYKTLKRLTLPIEMPPYGMLPSTYRTFLTRGYRYGSLGMTDEQARKIAGNMSFNQPMY